LPGTTYAWRAESERQSFVDPHDRSVELATCSKGLEGNVAQQWQKI